MKITIKNKKLIFIRLPESKLSSACSDSGLPTFGTLATLPSLAQKFLITLAPGRSSSAQIFIPGTSLSLTTKLPAKDETRHIANVLF
jgi:hypothetical protein